jgi:ABC-type antimicrobial peptide transport system permease subunit
MALVSFVFAAVLMLAEGLERTLIDTGSPDNAIVLRGASESEVSSVISRTDADIITVQPEVAQNPTGDPLAAKESIALVALEKRGSGKPANVVVRGVGKHSMYLRPQVKLVAGRYFRPGSLEIIAGASIAQRIEGASLEGKLRFALTDWKVVGVFDAGKTGFDSEVWGDSEQLMSALRRTNYSIVVLRVPSRSNFEHLKKSLESDPRLSVQVKREIDFYRQQSEVMARFIRILGTAMSLFFSLGAILAAMVTMYTAVANRITEIGTLRALGFNKASVLGSFLGESLLLGLIGGAVGIGCSSLLQFLTISTMNWETFSELAFGFLLTPTIVLYTLGFAAAMGLLGGLLPSWQAARLNIVDALRAS